MERMNFEELLRAMDELGLMVHNVFSNEVLEELTDEISRDEFMNLDSRDDIEIVEMFEELEFLTMNEVERNRYLVSKADEWAKETRDFEAHIWFNHFIDLLDYNDKAYDEAEAFLDSLTTKILQEKMYEKGNEVVYSLYDKGLINRYEQMIALDFVWQLSENNSTISEENNLLEEYLDDLDMFVKEVKNAYQEFLKEYDSVEKFKEKTGGHFLDVSMEYAELLI